MVVVALPPTVPEPVRVEVVFSWLLGVVALDIITLGLDLRLWSFDVGF